MEFQDKSLRCVDCGEEFIWTAGEQLFFADKQFKNEPKRCKSCKASRANRSSSGPASRERVETQATCSACGKDTTVPFRPTQGRPVFCKECFQQRKFAGAWSVSRVSGSLNAQFDHTITGPDRWGLARV
jgi:CxxC-x17-CxxC domain-containing protein